MARPRLSVAFYRDFTGGLNTTAARQALRLNETPDCMDIDFSQRGGFSSRRGYLNVTTSTDMDAAGYLVGHLSFGTEVLWGISDVGRLWTWNGASATHVATTATDDMTAKVRGVTWGGKLYLANCRSGGNIVMRTWDGTSWATLTNVVNNNYSAPAGGNAPLARLIADHAGHLWWADTVESGTRYRSRVRYSHPLQPADFAAADYFDLGSDDQTDEITALVPFRGQLLIFKKRGLWSVYGTDSDVFVPERISTEAGAWSHECVTVSPTHCYWWSPNGNVYSFDGRQIASVGDRILGPLHNGLMNPGNDGHWLTWAEDKLWVGLKQIDGTQVTYVLDPAVGSNGAWTRYSPQITSLVWWRRNTGVNGIMARLSNKPGVQDFNIPTQQVDDDGTTEVSIPAYYRTAWFSADDPARKKRWRRAHLTARANDTCTVRIYAHLDFNESAIRRTFDVLVTVAASGMNWGDNWGGNWSGTTETFSFERLPNAGRGNAIQFVFTVLDNTSTWGVDSFALPYQEKGYR